jgi:phosphoglycolate/pyridoxal phosphate phosphatase family enzyme
MAAAEASASQQQQQQHEQQQEQQRRPKVLIDDPGAAAALLTDVDTLLLDCDGVLWRGDEPIEGAVDALAALRAAGKTLRFVTNNSSKSRTGYLEKFNKLGIQASADEIVCSAYLAAAYLREAGFAGSGKAALVLGTDGADDELRQAGIPVLTRADALGCPPPGARLDTPEAMRAPTPDPRIGAVVLAWDPSFDYSLLLYAAAALRELRDSSSGAPPLFVATNADAYDELGGGRAMPGTGALLRALEAASGRAAANVGKGGPWLLPFLMRSLGIADPQRCAVVGDRLDSDIAVAREGGMLGVLTLTGVATLESALAAAPHEAPDAVIRTFADLAPHSSSDNGTV